VLFALSFEVGDPTKAIMLRLHNATDFGRLTASLADSPRKELMGKLHASAGFGSNTSVLSSKSIQYRLDRKIQLTHSSKRDFC
jgi:hypothetical protein